ncbi:ABC transporter substrate-binding protein [Beutenbergia cavernae]|nr:ABC transporter substrate-binding protein [Beutenbergia cavernae]
MSRRSFLGGAAAAGALTLGACGSPRSARDLTFLINHTNQEAQLFDEQIGVFLDGDPEHRITLQNIASGPQFYTRLRTVSVTNDLPDVWYARTLDTAFNVSNSWQLPLDEFIRDDPDAAVDDIWAAQVRQMSVDDVQYSMPYDLSCYCIYYNRTAFEEKGIDRPDDESWTWDELFEIAEAFTESSGGRQTRWGFYFSLGTWFFDGVFRSNGGGLFEDDGRTVVIASEENIATLDTFYAMMDSGVAAQPQTLGAAVDPFISGLVAMAVNGSWATAQTRDQIGDRFAWDVLKLPKGTTGRREVATAGGAWGISRDSANPELAWEFIRFLSDTERLNLFISEPLRGIPGRISAAEDEEAMNASAGLPPESFRILRQMLVEDAYEVTWPPFWAEFETIWNNRATALNGGARPRDVLTQIDSDVRAASARFFGSEGGDR